MGKIITQCPSCDCAKLQVTNIECLDCKTKFSGEFEIPILLTLSTENLEFILDFIKCSGSLKNMAVKQKISYPTLRNKLNTLIENIENINIKQHDSEADILHLLEEGKISAKDAAKMLKEL